MRRTVRAALAATTLAAASVLAAGTASAHFLSGTPYGHWSGDGHTNPYVWVDDHTGSAWPIHSATTQWNQGSDLDTFYEYMGNGNPNGDHWFAVYEYNSADGNAGSINSICNTNGCWTGHYIDSGNTYGHPYVELNDYYTTHGFTDVGGISHPALNSTQRMHVACQEIGHGFGLAHQTVDSTSCMNNHVYPDNHLNDTNVGTHTWGDLSTLYSHINSGNLYG